MYHIYGNSGNSLISYFATGHEKAPAQNVDKSTGNKAIRTGYQAIPRHHVKFVAIPKRRPAQTFLSTAGKFIIFNDQIAWYLLRREVRMEFSSSNVMAFVIRFCQSADAPIHVDKAKSQKLLYCCYGAVLAETNERLTDEHPKAWPYGPVFPRTFTDINKGRLTVGMARAFE